MSLVAALLGCSAPVPQAACPAGPHLLVSTTDFEVGALATVTLDGCLADNQSTSGTDVRIVSLDGQVAVVERSQSDAVRLYGPGEYLAPRTEFVPAPDGNVHDVVQFDDALWFAPWEADHLVRTDLAGNLLGSVSLADQADEDGLPEPDRLVVRTDGLFVGLQRLDRGAGFVPREGRIARVDASGVIATYPVGPNPKIGPHPADERRLTVLSGRYFEPDGALSVLDPADGSVVALVRESDLSFDFDGFAGIGAHGVLTGVAFEIDGLATLVCVNLDTGQVTDGATTPGWFVASVAAGNGVVVAVRAGFAGAAVDGLWWVDPETCAVRTLVDGFSLDPYDMAFVDPAL